MHSYDVPFNLQTTAVNVLNTLIEFQSNFNSILEPTCVRKQTCEPFTLKMYIRSSKICDFCIFILFVFVFALLSCLHTYMLSSDIKRARRQNIRK